MPDTHFFAACTSLAHMFNLVDAYLAPYFIPALARTEEEDRMPVAVWTSALLHVHICKVQLLVHLQIQV